MSAAARPSILVVSGDPETARDLASRLERLGYPLAGVADDGERAAALAGAARPGLAVVDLGSPAGGDGAETVRRLEQAHAVAVLHLAGERGKDASPQNADGRPGTLSRPLDDREIDVAIQVALVRHALEAERAAEVRLYQAEQQARAEAEALLRIAEALAETRLDLAAVVQRVTDEATSLVGAHFGAFFYNVVDEQGESYMLYTLSGAPREAFDKFGLPRNTPLFGPTFRGEGVVRLDDVHRDRRYGQMPPHRGMPKGHLPVRSYLAVPVISRNGPVIGGLFFGHPEPARFTEQHERMAKAVAAHAAAAVDSARLFAAAREAEERQGRLVRELERAVRFSEIFVGILGHDLRNPLSGITTAASLVLSRADSHKVGQPVSRILMSADRMRRMIDQILDFTHVRLGRGIPLQRTAVDLAEVCRLVLDELRSEVEEGSELQLAVDGDPAGTWDQDRLAQLVSNLAGNAVQHRRLRSPVELRIDGTVPERVVLEVANDGIIPAEMLPLIFEPLRPGEHRRREGSSGLGLGLYISQQIAAAHGGSIRVDSDAGRTRFTVELPRTAPAETDQVFGAGGDEKEEKATAE